MKNITVKYLFEGKIQEDENERGILLDDNRALVTKEDIAIYEVEATSDPSVYIVNLEKGIHDYLMGNESMIIDLLQPLIS